MLLVGDTERIIVIKINKMNLFYYLIVFSNVTNTVFFNPIIFCKHCKTTGYCLKEDNKLIITGV